MYPACGFIATSCINPSCAGLLDVITVRKLVFACEVVLPDALGANCTSDHSFRNSSVDRAAHYQENSECSRYGAGPITIILSKKHKRRNISLSYYDVSPEGKLPPTGLPYYGILQTMDACL